MKLYPFRTISHYFLTSDFLIMALAALKTNITNRHSTVIFVNKDYFSISVQNNALLHSQSNLQIKNIHYVIAGKISTTSTTIGLVTSNFIVGWTTTMQRVSAGSCLIWFFESPLETCRFRDFQCCLLNVFLQPPFNLIFIPPEPLNVVPYCL